MRRLSQLLVAAAVLALTACGGGGTTTPSNPPVTVGLNACCQDPNSCSANICNATLHCGNTQNPVPAYRCCAIGSFCCATEAECQPAGISPGYACDTANSACFTGCTTDAQCAAAFHCEGTACVADLADGTPGCDEPSDCASGNCSADFDPSSGPTTYCAPAGTCADGAQSYPVGYTLCSGNAWARHCDAEGTWSAKTNSPNLTNLTCDAGDGAASGFRAAAVCTSGLGVDPAFASTCASCAPYRATVSGCRAAGGCGNSNANCWTGYQCAASAGNVCAPRTNGSPCDNAEPQDCDSGRCDPVTVGSTAYTCQAKLANTAACDEDTDCTSGRCASATCQAQFDSGTACARDQDCVSGNCSADFDSGILYCASAGTCANDASAYPVGYKLCGPSTSRACLAEGVWASAVGYVAAKCTTPLGPYTGYTLNACTSGSGATNGYNAQCQSCNGAVVNGTNDGCVANCGGADANCIGSYYCSGTTCAADRANGVTCTRDQMCVSGRCDPNPLNVAVQICQAQLDWYQACDENSDCLTGYCIASQCDSLPPPKGSCPYVYAWDGAAYRYENDVQGPIVGNARFSSRIKFYGPQYVVLPSLQPDLLGDLRVKIRETLPEIDYVDEVKLLVFDLPEGYELQSTSAEDTYRMGFVAPFGVYTALAPISPIAATDQTGADILAKVRDLDDVIAPAPVVDPVYTFDFGPIVDPANARLVVDGWAVIGPEFANSTSLISYIDVVDESGGWVKAREFGFPSGDLKPMSISLAGLFRSSDHRIRMHLGRAPNSRWVLDRVRLDTSTPVAADLVTTLSPAQADLRERGALTYVASTYEHRIHAADDALPLVERSLGYGYFTGLGDVRALLGASDDTYVVMRHGDELEIVFTGADLPPPEPGMQRVYVGMFSLFYKVYDESRLSDPMPFHAMSAYPYPASESFPQPQYVVDWNTRFFQP